MNFLELGRTYGATMTTAQKTKALATVATATKTLVAIRVGTKSASKVLYMSPAQLSQFKIGMGV